MKRVVWSAGGVRGAVEVGGLVVRSEGGVGGAEGVHEQWRLKGL